MRKLVACLACRNQGSRLYGKPLQNLDQINKVTILGHILKTLKKVKHIDAIVLAISEGSENLVYQDISKSEKIDYVIGSQVDVLGRLIEACIKSGGSDIFRVTTESPFVAYEFIDDAWRQHIEDDNDVTVVKNIPDGMGFEIIKLTAYQRAWELGGVKYRTEYCSKYIYENQDKFKVYEVEVPNKLKRTDLRVTVDNPEDLILCRDIYTNFKEKIESLNMEEIIDYLDANPDLKNLVSRYV